MVAASIVSTLVQVKSLIQDCNSAPTGRIVGGCILQVPRTSAVERANRRIGSRNHIHNDLVQHVLGSTADVIVLGPEQLVDPSIPVRVCFAHDPLTNVATATAGLGHLVQSDSVVDALGAQNTTILLARASGHLNVELTVDVQACQPSNHSSRGQSAAGRGGGA